MSGITDFVLQVRDTERALAAEWQTVQQGWQDGVAEGFNNGVMIPYMRNFQQYLSGEGLSGYGLEQLLQQMDKHQQEMKSLLN